MSSPSVPPSETSPEAASADGVVSSDDVLTIGFVLTQLWHRVPGGTGSSALKLYGALKPRQDVRLIGIGAGGPRKTESVAYLPPPGTRQLRLPYQVLYDTWQRLGQSGPERLTGPVDVVHATTTLVPPVKNAKLVVTVHDLFPYLEPDVLTKRGGRILRQGIDLAKERADIVCCPSQQTINDCIEAGFDPDRIRLVPWGATVHESSISAIESMRERLGLARPYLLWLGTIEPRKNLPLLLRAFAQAELDGVDLVIAGPAGWNEDLDELSAPLGDRIHRLGFVAPNDLDPLYAGAQALVFPSLREGFGMPAVEAMAQGTPVVGSAGTAIAEVVGDSGVLVDPQDLDGWVEALRTAANPSWKEQLAPGARARSATFTWENSAVAQVDAYRAATA